MADRLHPRSVGRSVGEEPALHGGGSPLGEALVVRNAAKAVRVALDGHLEAGVLLASRRHQAVTSAVPGATAVVDRAREERDAHASCPAILASERRAHNHHPERAPAVPQFARTPLERPRMPGAPSSEPWFLRVTEATPSTSWPAKGGTLRNEGARSEEDSPGRARRFRRALARQNDLGEWAGASPRGSTGCCSASLAWLWRGAATGAARGPC